MGHTLAPVSIPVETPCVVSGRDAEVLGDLPREVAVTITSARAQDVDAETHFWVHPSPRLVCSDQPEGCVLSCLDPPAILPLRVRGSDISVQGPALWAVPVTSCLHQSSGSRPCFPERTACAHPQLPRRLAHTCTILQAVVRTQGPGAQAPQPVESSGQLGKEQTHANPEDLFSQHGVGFGQPHSTPHQGTCSIGAELTQDFIRQDGGPTEILSEAPGAYDCSCCDSSARSAPYETVSALAPWSSPEVGMEMRYSLGSDYTGLLQNLQPVDRFLVPSGRSAPGAGIQACCGIHIFTLNPPRPPSLPDHVSEAEQLETQINISLCGHALRSVTHGQNEGYIRNRDVHSNIVIKV